jgi:transcriptional regulator with XRE-family HTH domain
MSTAERIKRARIHAGLTQRQVAEAAGVSSLSVSRWERGETEPGVYQFRGLAEALGVSLEDLAPEATTA